MMEDLGVYQMPCKKTIRIFVGDHVVSKEPKIKVSIMKKSKVSSALLYFVVYSGNNWLMALFVAMKEKSRPEVLKIKFEWSV